MEARIFKEDRLVIAYPDRLTLEVRLEPAVDDLWVGVFRKQPRARGTFGHGANVRGGEVYVSIDLPLNADAGEARAALSALESAVSSANAEYERIEGQAKFFTSLVDSWAEKQQP